MANIGFILAALVSPLVVAAISLSFVLFIPPRDGVHQAVNLSAAIVLGAVVLPSMWVTFGRPLLAAQRRIAEAVEVELAAIVPLDDDLEGRYRSALSTNDFDGAKKLLEAVVPLRARRDALLSTRTMPISVAVLAPMTAAQVGSGAALVVKALEGVFRLP